MDDLVNQLSRTLACANRFIVAQLRERGLEGIAPSHGDILARLFAAGELSMQDLAHAIGRDPSTVTALVKKLVAAGYVGTRKDPRDRRATIVSLTERGCSLQGDFQAVSCMLRDVQSQGIDAADFAVVRQVLAAVRGNFENALKGEDR